MDADVLFDVFTVGYLDGWSIGGLSDIKAMPLIFGRDIMGGVTCVYDCWGEFLVLVW